MQGRKVLLTIVVSLLAFAMLSISFKPAEAGSSNGLPTFYVDSSAKRTTVNLISPIVFAYKAPGPRPGSQFWVYVKVARAPHRTTEPTIGTDATYAYEFKLSWNKDVLKLLATDVFKCRSGSNENFLEWHNWMWNDDDATPESGDEFWSWSPYSTGFGDPYIGPTLDYVQFGGTLLGTPQNNALPEMWNDAYAGPYNPAKALGLHSGAQYDMPWTYNLTSSLLQPDGSHTATDGCWQTVGALFFESLSNTVPSALHLYDCKLLDYSLTNVPSDTFDGYYGAIIVPEFPFGTAPILLLVPAISLLYLWRSRKNKLVK